MLIQALPVSLDIFLFHADTYFVVENCNSKVTWIRSTCIQTVNLSRKDVNSSVLDATVLRPMRCSFSMCGSTLFLRIIRFYLMNPEASKLTSFVHFNLKLEKVSDEHGGTAWHEFITECSRNSNQITFTQQLIISSNYITSPQATYRYTKRTKVDFIASNSRVFITFASGVAESQQTRNVQELISLWLDAQFSWGYFALHGNKVRGRRDERFYHVQHVRSNVYKFISKLLLICLLFLRSYMMVQKDPDEFSA